MTAIRFALFITLSLNLLGCGKASNTDQAKGLITEANKLLNEDVRVTSQWSGEYGKLFTPQNREQFPSNRESFRSRGERLVRFLNESSKLNEVAAEKMDQAARLVSSDKEKKGLTALTASIRKTIEINNLIKDQTLLASNVEIKDEKIFNEKFMNLMSLIQQKSKERDHQQAEGKKLLGW